MSYQYVMICVTRAFSGVLWMCECAGVFRCVCRRSDVCLWSNAAGGRTGWPAEHQKDWQRASGRNTQLLRPRSWSCHVQASTYRCCMGDWNSVQGEWFDVEIVYLMIKNIWPVKTLLKLSLKDFFLRTGRREELDNPGSPCWWQLLMR